MAREYRPTGRQLLRQHLKVQKARSALTAQLSVLADLNKKARGLEEIVEHDGRVYNIKVEDGVCPSVKVSHLGSVLEFSKLLGKDA